MSIPANPSLSEQSRLEHDEAVSGLIHAAIDALSDPALTTITRNATNLLTLVDRFSVPEVQKLLESILTNAESLAHTVDSLGKLTASGSLDKLLEITDFLRAILDSVNSALISSVVAKAVDIGVLLDRAATSPLGQLAPAAIEAMETAYKQSEQDSGRVKIKDLISILRDPETLANLKFALVFLKNLSIH